MAGEKTGNNLAPQAPQAPQQDVENVGDATKNPDEILDAQVKEENNVVSEQAEKMEDVSEAFKKYLGKETGLLEQLENGDDINLIVQNKGKESFDNEVIKGTEQLINNIESEKINTGNMAARLFKRAAFNIGKPFVALHQSRKFKKVLAKNEGDLDAAYKELGLEYQEGNAASEADATRLRARKAILDKRYLTGEEEVNKFDGEQQENVNDLLTRFHEDIKNAESAEKIAEIRKGFDQKLRDMQEESGFLNEGETPGKLGLTTYDKNATAKFNVDDIKEMANAIENIAKHEELGTEKIENYLKEHVTLYDARLKEGIYTERKTDAVVDAVVRGGAAGMFAALGVTLARSGANITSKNILGKIITSNTVIGGVVGAAVGGTFGAIKGHQEGKAKMSRAEAEAAESADALTLDRDVKAEDVVKENDETEEAKAEKDNSEDTSEKAEDEGETEVEKTEQNIDSKNQKKNLISRKIEKYLNEEDTLSKLEEKRDRKSAKELYENLDELLDANGKGEDNTDAILEVLADIRARSGVSSERKIDLISYSKGNTDKERLALLDKMIEAEKRLGLDQEQSENKTKVEEIIEQKTKELEKAADAADEIKKGFVKRQRTVRAIQGAVMGGVAGATFGALKDFGVIGGGIVDTKETNPDVDGGGIKVVDSDHDGTIAIYNAKGDELISESQGIHIDANGKIDEQGLDILRSKDIDITEGEVITQEHMGGASNKSIESFFRKDGGNFVEDVKTAEADSGNAVTVIERNSYVSIGDGDSAASIGNAEIVNEGDIQFKIAGGEDIDVDDLHVVLTPSNEQAGVGIVLDVSPDGTVTIPHDSVAASMYANGTSFAGGSIEVVRESASGNGFDVLATETGSGTLDSVTIHEPVRESIQTYVINGKNWQAPDSILAERKLALVDVEPMRNSGSVEFTSTNNEISVNGVAQNEAVEQIHVPRHTGGYSEVNDPFFSANKEAPALNSQNLVRQLVDPNYEMASNADADAALIEAVNNGTISTEQVTNAYLEQMGNSPEQIVEMRAMLGDLYVDIDGDGVAELIDSDSEINAVANMLKDSANSDGYDAFVNDTYERVYEKMDGGEIRLINYSEEPYDYTTLGYLDKLKNDVIHLFAKKETKPNGIGIEFLDKDKKSIYDLDIVRKVWKMPEGAAIEHVTERLNCGQKTADIEWVKAAGQPSGGSADDENAGSAGDETSGSAGDEGATPVSADDESAGTETGIETADDESSGVEPTGEEPTGVEPTGEEPTGVEIVGKTDTNPWEGNNPSIMPETKSFEQISAENDGARIVQRGQEIMPDVDTSHVNTNPADTQDWAEQPTVPQADTGTGGLVDQSASSDDEAAEMLRQAEASRGGGGIMNNAETEEEANILKRNGTDEALRRAA